MITCECVNLQEFRSAMALYSKHVPRDLGKALNWKALVITKDAQKGTPVAVRARIEYEMGIGGYELKQVRQGKNKGKLRKTNAPVWFQYPRAFNIIIGRWRKEGMGGLATIRSLMMEEARRMVMAKIRAMGSAKAGWNKPLRMLAAAVKGQAFVPASKTRVKLEGYGKGANKDQWKKVVEVSYDVLDKTRHIVPGMGAAYPKVEAALKTAMSAEAKRTVDYIAQTIKRNPLFIKNYR